MHGADVCHTILGSISNDQCYPPEDWSIGCVARSSRIMLIKVGRKPALGRVRGEQEIERQATSCYTYM